MKNTRLEKDTTRDNEDDDNDARGICGGHVGGSGGSEGGRGCEFTYVPPLRLQAWQDLQREARDRSRLFDTRWWAEGFRRMLQGAWEVMDEHLGQYPSQVRTWRASFLLQILLFLFLFVLFLCARPFPLLSRSHSSHSRYLSTSCTLNISSSISLACPIVYLHLILPIPQPLPPAPPTHMSVCPIVCLPTGKSPAEAPLALPEGASQEVPARATFGKR